MRTQYARSGSVRVWMLRKASLLVLRVRRPAVILGGILVWSTLWSTSASILAGHAPEIDGKLYIADVPEGMAPVPGDFYRCEITETHDYDLVGKII